MYNFHGKYSSKQRIFAGQIFLYQFLKKIEVLYLSNRSINL